MNVIKFRELLAAAAETHAPQSRRVRDSIILADGELHVGMLRISDKYSNAFQEANYWLVAGHSFITIDGQRDREFSDNHLLYPFRIPWVEAPTVSVATLAYNPLNWESREYQPLVIRFGEDSAEAVGQRLTELLALLRAVFEALRSLSPEQALAKIKVANGSIWLGKQYIKAYRLVVDKPGKALRKRPN